MDHVISQPCIDDLAGYRSSGPAFLPSDVIASLTAASTDAWEVEQTVDPFGEVSIIVLPRDDDPALPTFMLYEGDGVARVATIRHEAWESEKAYHSSRRAVAAIIAETAAISSPLSASIR